MTLTLATILLAASTASAKVPVFDARQPSAIVAILTAMGAKTELAKSASGEVIIQATTPGGGFGLQFVDCDATTKACKALAFSTTFARRGVNLGQLNSFNRDQIACRGFLAADGTPSVMYSTVLTKSLTPEDVKLHIGVWQGCLETFAEFSKDPDGYLKP